MPGEGTHVLGIEPANCHVEGRTVERVCGYLVKRWSTTWNFQ